MSRANGWYFVRIDDEWRPAEWFDGDWDLSPMMALLILEVDEDPISIAIHAENRQLRAKVAELESHAAIGRRAVEMLLALVDELDCLIGESGGVYGLHLNGDPSPWSEILQGGRFERLCSLDDARLFVTEQAAPELSTVATDGLWQPASADDGMRNIDISDVCGGQTDCEPATVAVDAGALEDSQLLDDLELVAREYMTGFSVVYRHACDGEPGGFVAMRRRHRTEPAPTLREAARRLLAGGDQ